MKMIETKICKCGVHFDITNNDLEFYEKISPVFNGSKFLIPPPTLCPDCRQQRRLTYRMESKLYKRTCDATQKPIISMYSPNKKDTVYEYSYWWSDKWDAMDYGKDFDFSRTFFEQFKELLKKVPKAHIEISPSENSEYTNQAGFNKNCYLCFESGYSEDCMYSNGIWNTKNTLDSSYINFVENCYECIDVKNSYGVFFSIECNNCRDSEYLIDCQNCNNCLGCWNLRGKEYYILNEQVSREVYEKTLADLKSDLQKKKEFLKVFNSKKKEKLINKNLHNLNSENALGNNIVDCKNCSGFDIFVSQNCTDSYTVYDSIDCKDFSYWGNKTNLIYESTSIGNTASNIIFSWMCYDNVSNLIYSMNCVNGSSNLFGCVGLKNKQYCILNKQYSKEEYYILVSKIIEHMKKTSEWGEFFPVSISPFGYNETIAVEYFPITKKEALSKGFNWSDYENPIPKVDKIIPASKLPENIRDIPDDILNWAVECDVTGRPFRIIKPELEFYRKHNLPIPRKHPDERHNERMKLRSPRKIFDRKCDKCGIAMKTTFAPEIEEIVYCESCYDKTIY